MQQRREVLKSIGIGNCAPFLCGRVESLDLGKFHGIAAFLSTYLLGTLVCSMTWCSSLDSSDGSRIRTRSGRKGYNIKVN